MKALQTKRYESLDCIRGIAAFSVLTRHSFQIATEKNLISPDIFSWLPIHVLIGGEPVTLFFVLSGFSLFLMFDSLNLSRSPSLIFIVSRWIRLYPVYIFAILFSIVSYSVLTREGFLWRGEIDPVKGVDLKQFLLHLTLVGQFNFMAYNGPIWSIVQEMRISIIFPILYFCLKRHSTYTLITSILIAVIVAVAYLEAPGTFDAWKRDGVDWIGTAYYSSFFAFGGFIAKERSKLADLVGKLTTKSAALLFITLLLLYWYSGYVFYYLGLVSFPFSRGINYLMTLVVGIWCGGLIVMAITVFPLRLVRVLRPLGRVSFSLYLIHWPCLFIIYITMSHRLPVQLLLPMGMAVSLAMAIVTWLLIEKPALAWSRVIRSQNLIGGSPG